MNTAAALRVKTAGLWLAIFSALTVGAVLVLQYGYGYAPCKLCLTERLPFYAALPFSTIDWTLRAQLRVLAKRILRKYGYPPDKQEEATQTVLERAALLSADWAVA